ncbi:MAG: hypothetical protein ACI837_002625 [Crocinitomicaceae bacterium]|jgi:hypothetical protein
MRKFTYCSLSLLFSFLYLGNNAQAQDLFDINTIRTVEIDFYDSDWDHLLDSLASIGVGTGSGSERILADVTIDGILFDSCGVRYKGNSSMDTTSNKNPFNIDLNFIVAGQSYFGKNKLKLANCFTDPSMIREALTYEIANKYMDGPHGSFVKVYLNGTYHGIYTNTESVDNEFLDTYYGSSGNAFFKCDPLNFDLAAGNSNLAYYADTTAYDTLYFMKSIFGTEELQTLCYNLENNIANIDQYLDVDRALWFLALSSALVHNDGYSAFQHNYYVYKMDNGRWSIVIWDVNMSFGGLLWNGTNFLPLDINGLQNQEPFLHQFDFALRPLISRLLSIPAYKRVYTAHYRTIMEENITNGDYMQRGEAMQALIDTDRQAEVFNEYSYSEFTQNLYTDVGVWFGLRPGLENLMEARDTYISSLPDFQFLQPTITNVAPSNTSPPPFTVVSITADIVDANTAMLGYRSSHYDVFTRVQMFDDGLNNDGAAGDGVYGATISIGSSEMEYYIYADNGVASKLSPVRAEYEFYTLVPEKTVVINEIDAININNGLDQNFEFDDWIELYNNSASPISLDGYHLSDDFGTLDKWAFPDTTIAPGQYLIVWADIDTLQLGLHANFALDQLGENVFLTDNFGFITDQVIFPLQTDFTTWGRFPNGTGSFTTMFPTISAENTTPLAIEEEELTSMTVHPNPSSGQTVIQFSKALSADLRITDMSGKIVLEDEIENDYSFVFDVSNFESGMYFISTSLGDVIKLVVE